MKRLVSVDSETHLIRPGLLTPPIVCGSEARFEETAEGLVARGRLLYPGDYLDELERLLLDPEVILVGANIAFDFGVAVVARPHLLRPVFDAYRTQRVYDILIAESLNAIARGHLGREPNGLPLLSARGTQTDRYSLDVCVRLNLGRGDAKVNDFWKLRYALLESLSHEQWPEEARQYPVDDAVNQLLVAAHQLGLPLPDRYYGAGRSRAPYDNLVDLPAQAESDWALHLGAIWGLRTDGERVDILAERAEELHREYVAKFTETGFFRRPRPEYLPGGKKYGKEDKEAGKKDTLAVARAVAAAYGASGTCEECRGAGKKARCKSEPCRGYRPTGKGRWPGCPGAGCLACAGTGTVSVAADPVFCERCAGTGFGDIRGVPLTDGGTTGVRRISSSRDALDQSGDDLLVELGENKHEKVCGTYVPYLRKGVDQALTLEPNVLLETGRVSYSGPIQLFPRGSLGVTADGRWVPTPRECFVARPGRVLGSSDYPGGELCALAQICLWLFDHSEMARIINANGKPGELHTSFAAKLLNEPWEAFKARYAAGDKKAKIARSVAKSTNFALGGGMGPPTFVLNCRKENAGITEGPDGRRYTGIRFCITVDGAYECGTEKIREWGSRGHAREIPPTCKRCVETVARVVRPLWFEMFPEVKLYHDWVGRRLEACDNVVPAFSPRWPGEKWSHRYRDVSGARSPYSAGCNSGFQQFIADVAKDALREVTRESYLDEASVLYQGHVRAPSFQHDELVSDGLIDTAHLWGPRIGVIMHEAYKRWIPDVRIEGVDTALMTAWHKDAEAVYDESGKLIVWEPKKS